MEKKLIDAAISGDAPLVAEILTNNPDIDINWKYEKISGRATAHWMADKGIGFILGLLLTHPDIDVNMRDNSGCTPLLLACEAGNFDPVGVLLKDFRVDVNEPNYESHTPLYRAAFSGSIFVIQTWIASGREMNLGRPGKNTDVIRIAKERGNTEALTLLERFKENPVETRHQVRLKSGWYDEAAAEIFALAVFVSDGLLQVTRGNHPTTTPTAKFVAVASHLPLELQMVLCYRVAGSAKEIIPNDVRELAFKILGNAL